MMVPDGSPIVDGGPLLCEGGPRNGSRKGIWSSTLMQIQWTPRVAHHGNMPDDSSGTSIHAVSGSRNGHRIGTWIA